MTTKTGENCDFERFEKSLKFPCWHKNGSNWVIFEANRLNSFAHQR